MRKRKLPPEGDDRSSTDLDNLDTPSTSDCLDDAEYDDDYSDDGEPKLKRKPGSLPEKGTKEYKRIRNEDARERRLKRAAAHKCPECDFTATFPNKIRIHMQTNHTEGRFKCSMCQSKFNTQSEHRKHMKEKHTLVHVCDVCKAQFEKLAYLKNHMTKTHLHGMKCTIPGCSMTLLKRNLKRHLIECHSQDDSIPSVSRKKVAMSHKCSHCAYKTDNLEQLNEHIDHAHITGFQCPMVDCEERLLLGELEAHFDSCHSDALDGEKETVSDEAPGDNRRGSKAEDGDDEAATASTTINDAFFHEESDLEPLSELVSEREVANVALPPISSEESVQHGSAGFTCSTCGSRLKDLYNLRKHVKAVHEKSYKTERRQKKHKCSFNGCTKSFTTVGLLEDHLNLHNDVKPYRCDHCQQSFHARARFAVHLSKYHQMSIRAYDALQRCLPR